MGSPPRPVEKWWRRGGSSALAPFGRRRMCRDVVGPALDPPPQDLGICEGGVCHVQHALHGAPAEVEWSHVRLRDKGVELGWLDTHDQVVLEHTAAHLAAHHKRQATEHPLFFDVGPVGQESPDAVGEFLVVGHAAHHIWLAGALSRARLRTGTRGRSRC